MSEIYKNLSLENLENEIWLPIEGYDGLYEVSNMGRVKSLRDRYGKPREKILSQCDNGNGYLFVRLHKDEKVKNCKVHRLVASAFIPNPNNYPTVNHNNEIKTDNRVCNLCWMGYSQQQRHGTCIQRRVASTGYKELVEKLSRQVYQYDKKGELVAIYPSVAECKRNGYIQSAVSACCRGELKSHRGYIWSYTEINQK